MSRVAAVLQSMFPGIDLESECAIDDYGQGPRIVKWNRPEKQPTMQEIDAAWPAVQAAIAAEEVAKKAADDQQGAGIVEAKKAYARLQTIIDNVDTATTAQLRAAIKEMATDLQHLIRAAVR